MPHEWTQHLYHRSNIKLVTSYPNSPEVGTIFYYMDNGYYEPENLYSHRIKHEDLAKYRNLFQIMPYGYKIVGRHKETKEPIAIERCKDGQIFSIGDTVEHAANTKRDITCHKVIGGFKPMNSGFLVLSDTGEELWGFSGLIMVLKEGATDYRVIKELLEKNK